MILLLDIGNTHTHLGLGNTHRVGKQTNIPTLSWFRGGAEPAVARFIGARKPEAVVFCSVVPRASPHVQRAAKRLWNLRAFGLTATTPGGIGIDYPKPRTIGPDRLANALAARAHFGAPSVVVDFGTAVTFDIIDRAGNFVGGIIAPGLAAMTDYLHESTALLPRIKIREINTVIGKSTEQAMLIGAVHGYRGLIRELVGELKLTLQARVLPVIATGGYARLMASKMPEITAVVPQLTLEGLRLVWLAQKKGADGLHEIIAGR